MPRFSLGGAAPLSGEFALHIAGKTWGLWGTHGFFLTQGGTYDVAVMVLFLFEMVFMNTAATIVTGGCAERCKFAAFAVSSVFLAAITNPLFANWAWGEDGLRAWLQTLGWEPAMLTSRVRAWFTRWEDCPRSLWPSS